VNGIARTQFGAEGSVTPQGVLVMRLPYGQRFDGQIDGQGTVRARLTTYCSHQLVWQKAPASTTAFDGKYIGVSRESSKTASAPSTECPPSHVPAPLTITNGVVWSDRASWEGTVSPQGAVVMRNPTFPRVDAQIALTAPLRDNMAIRPAPSPLCGASNPAEMALPSRRAGVR
jgi:hypothetical protein